MTNKATHSVFVTMGASNHTGGDRPAEDLYTTDPIAIDKLLSVETFSKKIWEPACGLGDMSEALKEHGFEVFSSDMYQWGYKHQHCSLNFLSEGALPYVENDELYRTDIVTNPPYKMALPFVKRALSVVATGQKVAMFLKLTFLESKSRRAFFELYPPARVHVFSERVQCFKNGDRNGSDTKAICYAWFVWIKGYKGRTEVDWI